MNNRKLWLLPTVAALTLVLSACSDDDDDNDRSEPIAMAEYDVTVTNLTAGQPLSPAAVVLHNSNWQSFSVGQAASAGLETLAEGGDNSAYLADADASSDVYAGASGEAPIPPGGSATINVKIPESMAGTLYLTTVSMLVNSNDALAAVNNVGISSLAESDETSFNALSYDSGTEANLESADTIPGPAGGAGAREGFNAARDDIRDEVHVHAGVVTGEDGLSGSALSDIHRWDHPVMRVSIKRVD